MNSPDLREMVAALQAGAERTGPTPAHFELVKSLAAGVDAAMLDLSPRDVGAVLLLTGDALTRTLNELAFYRSPESNAVVNLVCLMGSQLFAGWPE